MYVTITNPHQPSQSSRSTDNSSFSYSSSSSSSSSSYLIIPPPPSPPSSSLPRLAFVLPPLSHCQAGFRSYPPPLPVNPPPPLVPPPSSPLPPPSSSLPPPPSPPLVRLAFAVRDDPETLHTWSTTITEFKKSRASSIEVGALPSHDPTAMLPFFLCYPTLLP